MMKRKNMNSKRTNNNEFLTKMKKMIDNLEGNLIQQKKLSLWNKLKSISQCILKLQKFKNDHQLCYHNSKSCSTFEKKPLEKHSTVHNP